MPHNLPNKEQMLYAHLAIIESLLDYLSDNIADTEFDESAVHDYLNVSRDKIVRVQSIMKNILTIW